MIFKRAIQLIVHLKNRCLAVIVLLFLRVYSLNDCLQDLRKLSQRNSLSIASTDWAESRQVGTDFNLDRLESITLFFSLLISVIALASDFGQLLA